jgi:CubicO group peptidase (beta-lactamase class C family)
MKKLNVIWLCCVLLSTTTIDLIAQTGQSGPWQKYVNPSDAGFDAEKLALTADQFKNMRSAAFMVIYKGKVLVDYGDVTRRFMTHSIRKSFMSAMYGIYEDRGDINLYKTLDELGVDDIGGLTELELTARVHDLITARSGIYHSAAYEPRGMKSNRPKRSSKRPGESFFYNNWDFNTLHSILEKEAKIKFFDEFVNEVANPLGMEDLRSIDMRYRTEPNLSDHAAYLFKMSTRDMARFGQLYLDGGKWNDKQIVPKEWVDQSTAIYTYSPPGFSDRGGYGYLWWVDPVTFDQPAYYASGLGGHRLLILPESDLVIVHRVNSYLQMSAKNDDINKLVKMVLEAKTGEGITNPSTKTLNLSATTVPNIKISSSEFQKYEGVYNHRFFGDITVAQKDGEFFVKGEILGRFRMFSKSQTEFVIEDLPELPAVFKKATAENPKGKAITEANERRIPQRFVMYY